jgi:hypothetical protein
MVKNKIVGSIIIVSSIISLLIISLFYIILVEADSNKEISESGKVVIEVNYKKQIETTPVTEPDYYFYEEDRTTEDPKRIEIDIDSVPKPDFDSIDLSKYKLIEVDISDYKN